MRNFIAALAALFAFPASAATLPATASTVKTVVASAVPGDVVTMSGAFPAIVQVTGKSGLTLDASAASLTGLMVKASTNITVRGGTFADSGTYIGAIHVTGSRGVDVVGILASGGVMFRDSFDVALRQSRVERAKVGVALLRVTGGKLIGNAFWNLSIDGMNVASSHDVTVEHNVCAGSRLADDHHPDCFQAWSLAGERPTSNITVRFNHAHGANQGFSFFDHGAGGFDRVTIEGNTATISYPNAFSLFNSRDSIVRDNHARTMPGSRWRAWVYVIGATNLTRCDNEAEAGGEPVKPAIVDPACP